jgi:hypothetical protein
MQSAYMRAEMMESSVNAFKKKGLNPVPIHAGLHQTANINA